MILLTALLVLQAADAVTAVTVRDGDRRTVVPVVMSRDGAVLRASQLMAPIGGRLTRVPPDRAILEAGGARIELTSGIPFVRVGNDAVPVSVPPVVRDGDVLLPIVLVSEVLPRYSKQFTWDRRTATVARARSVESAGTVAATTRSAVPARGDSTAPARRVRPLVVVDAGHGGPDRGMSGTTTTNRTVHEAEITLAVAKRLRASLQARGVEVLMTRTTDTLIALRDRGRMANEADATLFLSIHVNAANPRWRNPRSARGFETYFLSDAKTEDEQWVAEMENEADRFLGDVAEPGDPLAFVLSDMVQNLYLRESSQLAATVQAGIGQVHPSRSDRGVKQAGFAVLVAAHRPAILVELGFGTNAAEATWMASARGQQALADAIADATDKYLADYARRLGGAAIGGR